MRAWWIKIYLKYRNKEAESNLFVRTTRTYFDVIPLISFIFVLERVFFFFSKILCYPLPFGLQHKYMHKIQRETVHIMRFHFVWNNNCIWEKVELEFSTFFFFFFFSPSWMLNGNGYYFFLVTSSNTNQTQKKWV